MKNYSVVKTIASFLLLASLPLSAAAPKIDVFKTATCGCCGKWVEHLKANGFGFSGHGKPAERRLCRHAVRRQRRRHSLPEISGEVAHAILRDFIGSTPLEFRLVYKGSLPSETSKPRVKEKHRIRKLFHKQLREL